MTQAIKSTYISEQTQRTLRVIKAMVGHEFTGISPKEIADMTKDSASNITRVLANLEYVQWVERVPHIDKHYRLSTAFVQISNTVAFNFNQLQQQLQQDQHNFTRLAV